MYKSGPLLILESFFPDTDPSGLLGGDDVSLLTIFDVDPDRGTLTMDMDTLRGVDDDDVLLDTRPTPTPVPGPMTAVAVPVPTVPCSISSLSLSVHLKLPFNVSLFFVSWIP